MPGWCSNIVSATRRCGVDPRLRIDGAGHECIRRVGGLAGREFDRLGQDAGKLQRVDGFAARLCKYEIFIILLCPPEPFELDSGNRHIHPEPLAGIEPRKLAGVGGLIGQIGAGENGIPEDKVLLEGLLDANEVQMSEETRAMPTRAHIAFIASGAEVRNQPRQIGAKPVPGGPGKPRLANRA